MRDGRPFFDNGRAQVRNRSGRIWADAKALLDALPHSFDGIQIRTARRPALRSDAAHHKLVLGDPRGVDRCIVLDEAQLRMLLEIIVEDRHNMFAESLGRDFPPPSAST